jgi:predicted lipid carrier protein YhbT
MKVPTFDVPPALGRLLGRMPRTPPAFAVSLALNLVRGRLYDAAAFEPLRGRSLAVRVQDAGIEFAITLGDRGFAPAPRGRAPDVTIAASARDFLALALRVEDADSLFFTRRLRMEGDTELGLYVKNTLDAIDFTSLGPEAFLRRSGWKSSAHSCKIPSLRC